MGFSMLAFALISYIEDKTTFIVLAFIIRFLQGFASSSIQTTCFSITSVMYAKRQQELIGYIECCIGFGLVIAPLLGSLLYSAGGITVPFYTFAAIFLVVAISVFRIIPDKADFMNTENLERVEIG